MGKKSKKGKKSKNGQRASAARHQHQDDTSDPPTRREGCWKTDLKMQNKVARYRVALPSIPPRSVIEGICRGRLVPTQAVVELSGTHPEDNACLRRLVDAGIFDAVLGLLKRCVDEEFADILDDVWGERRRCEDETVASPFNWVCLLGITTSDHNILGSTRMEDCHLLIAQNIGPLVQCMIDDTRRELYKENLHWHCTIASFVKLLGNLVLTSATIPILLGYEGLTDVIIQSMFWEAHRPDIVEESKSYGTVVFPDSFSVIAESAGFVISKMANVMGNDKQFDKRARRRLDNLARTSIVSSAYNSDANETLFAVGLTQLLGSITASPKKNNVFWILHHFVFTGNVDSRVIKGLVTYGTKIDTYEDTKPVVRLLSEILGTSSQTRGLGPLIPNDARFAIAIKSGLLDMILRLVQIFQFEVNDGLISIITNLLNMLGQVALMKRSSKALSDCHSKVLIQLQMINQSVFIGHRCLGVVDSIRSIVIQFTNDANALQFDVLGTCRRCDKKLQAKDRMVCSRCKHAAYCGKECQIADWHDGHKHDCKNMRAHLQLKKMAGLSKNDVEKAKLHEKNVIAVGSKLFTDNIDVIMMRAIFQGCSILDCVVCISFLQTPLSIELKPAAEFIRERGDKNCRNISSLTQGLERRRSNGIAAVAYYFLTVGEKINDAGIPTSCILFEFSGKGAPFGSWEAYQENMEADMPEDFDVYKEDEELREDFLRKRMKFHATSFSAAHY